jgi:hypothetical protein
MRWSRCGARGISEEEARLVLEDPDREGEANFGRLYAQKEIGHRRIRVSTIGVPTRP